MVEIGRLVIHETSLARHGPIFLRRDADCLLEAAVKMALVVESTQRANLVGGRPGLFQNGLCPFHAHSSQIPAHGAPEHLAELPGKLVRVHPDLLRDLGQFEGTGGAVMQQIAGP